MGRDLHDGQRADAQQPDARQPDAQPRDADPLGGRQRGAHPGTSRRQATFWIVGVLVTLLLAGFASSFASSAPDGLERVAESFGFSDTATDSAVAGSPLNDYQVKGVDDPRVSTGLSGVIGVVITGAVVGGLLLVLRRRRGPGH